MDSGQVPLNDFQKRVEQRLNAALEELGLQVDSRRVGREEVPFSTQKPTEAVIHIMARDLDVVIREDSVGFTISGKDDYIEMLDYSNADALADAFLAALTQRWH
jgi:hypothetical protein